MKDRLQEIAEDIAFEKYLHDFYELTEEKQAEVWKQAEERFADEMADIGDRLLDEQREKEGR